jgi:hypothetical protein
MDRNHFILAPTVALALAGCASQPERPSAELTRARTVIGQAEKDAKTQQYAAADLQLARDKLNQADMASKDGRNAEAEQLAMQAALDAEYATAKAGNGEAQKAADELDRSIETLRQDAARQPAQ